MPLTPDGDKLENDSLEHMDELYKWANASVCPGVAALLNKNDVKVADIIRGSNYKVIYGNFVNQTVGVTLTQYVGYKCDTVLAPSQELKVGVVQKINFALEHSINFAITSSWVLYKKELNQYEEKTVGGKIFNFLTLGMSGLYHKKKYAEEDKKVALIKNEVAKRNETIATENVKIAKAQRLIAEDNVKIAKITTEVASAQTHYLSELYNAKLRRANEELLVHQTELQKANAKLLKQTANLASINALTLLPG